MKPDIGRRDEIKGSCGRLLPRGTVWPAADPKKCSVVVNKAHTVFDRHLGGNLTTWLSLNPLKTIGAGDNRQPIFCADGGEIVPLHPAPESSPGGTQEMPAPPCQPDRQLSTGIRALSLPARCNSPTAGIFARKDPEVPAPPPCQPKCQLSTQIRAQWLATPCNSPTRRWTGRSGDPTARCCMEQLRFSTPRPRASNIRGSSPG
jgi:hypothetical protein